MEVNLQFGTKAVHHHYWPNPEIRHHTYARILRFGRLIAYRVQVHNPYEVEPQQCYYPIGQVKSGLRAFEIRLGRYTNTFDDAEGRSVLVMLKDTISDKVSIDSFTAVAYDRESRGYKEHADKVLGFRLAVSVFYHGR